MNRKLVSISRYLSLVLRHRPEMIGFSLDRQGWVRIDELLEKAAARGRKISKKELLETVEKNDKQRFAISPDGSKIRASQGHSVKVDLGLSPVRPPEILYHGTACHNVESIGRKGLVKGSRHHVHLSPDEETAVKVGRRHGEAVVLGVLAGAMHEKGHAFFLSENKVWLTDWVPPEFIVFPDV